MKAVRYEEFGGPEVLRVMEVDAPRPRAGEVRIAVRAAAVNPVDWKMRSGAFGSGRLPAGTGMDAAGIVDQVGEGVDDIAVGEAVFGSSAPGAIAEYAVLREWARKPESLSFEEAAGFVMTSETARRALNLLPARAGETLVVNGASGGVGLAAVQFALADGLTVIGTASEANHEFLRGLGVIPVVYGDGLVERVRSAAPDGVDGAVDIAGSGALPQLIELTGRTDRVITIADPAADQYGVRMTSGKEGHAPEARAEAAALFEQGRFTMPVARIFSMDEVAEAHAASERGHVRGKYIVQVAS
ncbi:NADP-dependent oxidoreductase [Brevibacterium album]|uniref:NADP-dependent oxidoreductase n=1 Tax=Brevibacterium album TaxID=417948 RepID=UPI00048FB693|nr:NADP-dependent oxidoreductase [Brevibacterium album]